MIENSIRDYSYDFHKKISIIFLHCKSHSLNKPSIMWEGRNAKFVTKDD